MSFFNFFGKYLVCLTLNIKCIYVTMALKVHRSQHIAILCDILANVFVAVDMITVYLLITCGRLPWEEVWTPDIVLYNAAGDGEQGREMRTLIQVPHCTLCHVCRWTTRATWPCWPRPSTWASAWWTSPTTPSTCSCASSSSPPGPRRWPGWVSCDNNNNSVPAQWMQATELIMITPGLKQFPTCRQPLWRDD